MHSYEVASAWLKAISDQDRAAALTLTADDISIHGPNGIARGQAVIEVYFSDYPMKISIRQIIDRGNDLVVFHRIEFLDLQGVVQDSIENAAIMTVRDGKVASYRRANEDDDLSPSI